MNTNRSARRLRSSASDRRHWAREEPHRVVTSMTCGKRNSCGGALIPRQTTESIHTEAEVLRSRSTTRRSRGGRGINADLEQTSDLQDETAADRTPVLSKDSTSEADSVASQKVEAKARVNSKRSVESRASAADLMTSADLPLAPVPRLPMLGFFAFATCALIAAFFGTQWDPGSSHSNAKVISEPPRTDDAQLPRTRAADGQRQLAIYVPLRNDPLKEEDETFKVCLRSPRQSRIDESSCAEATIRDDDVASQI